MTRKLTRNYSLSVVGASVALLALLIVAAVRAQVTGPLDSNPLFLSAVVYDSGGSDVGGFAMSVAVADVNGDGQPDLVVTNGSSKTVGVLLGNGDGTFRSAVTYSLGVSNPTAIKIADVNGDGKPDLVAGLWQVGVSVLLGNGDGTFQPAVTYHTGTRFPQVTDVAVADVNGDGKPDLIVVNLGYVVGVLLGNGDGTFQPAVLYSSGDTSCKSVAVADVNHDGKLDVVVANESGTVGVLLGNGDGTFQPALAYDSGGSEPWSIAVADVNGDGKPDIVVANCGGSCDGSEGSVGVLLGNGDGTFQAAVTYDSGGGLTGGIAIADVNGDGKPDLLTANGSSNNVGVLLGNGDGTFQPALTYGSGGGDPKWIVAADLDGDRKPDLVVTNQCGTTCNFGNVGVLLNNTGPHNPTTTTLVSAPNPSVFGQLVSFTAVVSSSSGTPAGVVDLFEGPAGLGSATLTNGTASIPVSSLAAGSHSIIAVYQGSKTFSPSTSHSLHEVVNTAKTTTALASSVNPAHINKAVTYTATVTSQYGGAATGTATFQDEGSTISTVPLADNRAAYSTTYTKGGTHVITATYSGDANNTGSISPTLLEQIKYFPSKTVLSTSGSPSFVGQPVTFTATVTSTNGAIPDGELVTFYDGTIAVGTSATVSGMATFLTSSLTAKTHTIKGAYAGDAIFKTSGGTVTQVVEGYATTTTLSSSLNPSKLGEAVTFTAHVTSSGSSTPTGTVRFLDGTVTIGSATLSGGVAKLTKSNLAVGTHPITAQYLGDAASAKSTSSVLDQVVH